MIKYATPTGSLVKTKALMSEPEPWQNFMIGRARQGTASAFNISCDQQTTLR
jgi:hypothetical protein